MMKRALALLLFSVFLALTPAWAGLWEEVCQVLMVDHTKIQKPRVVIVRPDEIPGYVALYLVPFNVVCTTTLDEGVLAHEYAHAVMCSKHYQEMRAGWVERAIELKRDEEKGGKRP